MASYLIRQDLIKKAAGERGVYQGNDPDCERVLHEVKGKYMKLTIAFLPKKAYWVL